MSERSSPLLHPARSRRVCIVLLTGIGDVVHGLPLASDLKRRAPDREVVWVAEPAPAEVLRHHPAVDRVVVFRKRAGLRGLAELFSAFRGASCDVTLNLVRYFKGVFPALASGAPIRLGLPPSKTRDGVRFFHTHTLQEGPWCHTQDLFLRFREPLGIPSDDPVEWRVSFSTDERAAQADYFARLRQAGAPIVGVVLATANPAKDWPAESYPDLVARLVRELGARVLLIGGPSARERERAARVMRSAPVGTRSEVGDSVRRMMWLVDGADVLVSPDTGPLHLAHALEVPVVGLFGHTNPWRVGPWRRYHDLVIDHYTDPGEPPEPSSYEPRSGRMASIPVDEVLARVRRALADYR